MERLHSVRQHEYAVTPLCKARLLVQDKQERLKAEDDARTAKNRSKRLKKRVCSSLAVSPSPSCIISCKAKETRSVLYRPRCQLKPDLHQMHSQQQMRQSLRQLRLKLRKFSQILTEPSCGFPNSADERSGMRDCEAARHKGARTRLRESVRQAEPGECI